MKKFPIIDYGPPQPLPTCAVKYDLNQIRKDARMKAYKLALFLSLFIVPLIFLAGMYKGVSAPRNSNEAMRAEEVRKNELRCIQILKENDTLRSLALDRIIANH